jgi:hypothetical protein
MVTLGLEGLFGVVTDAVSELDVAATEELDADGEVEALGEEFEPVAGLV